LHAGLNRLVREYRLIRDIGRKTPGQADLKAIFEWPLTKANQIRSQQQRQRGWKLYSFHAPEVQRVGKTRPVRPTSSASRHASNSVYNPAF
jgi:hypothetical protein